MKIAIIGAGFTGLAAALELSKSGHKVTVYEKESQAGGLAIGFKDQSWDWALEKHYHHLFTSDRSILDLAKQVHHTISFYRPMTATFTDKYVTQLDSMFSLLNFNKLSFVSRIRTGIGLASLRFNPFWQPLERITAKEYIERVFGNESWKKLWEPLMIGKFGKYSDKIVASWFWARISKRSASLGYPEGGFQALADSIVKSATGYGAVFLFDTNIIKIKNTNLILENGNKMRFDKIICTLPTQQFSKLSGIKYEKSSGLGAVNLILALKRPFLPKDIYWLNNNDRSLPFLAIVDHTNFVSMDKYGSNNLVYIGNYLNSDHKYFAMNEKQLLSEFLPGLKKINTSFDKTWIKNIWVWKAAFAQPIVTRRYSQQIPSIRTTIKDLYLANIQQVYPWDRGTNFAVELGLRVAKMCINDL